MLKSIFVKNFAIIDNVSIDFSSGMTVLTGETGAGKSLIIDAIGLLFGDRSNTQLVRRGETKAVIEGVFDNVNQKLIDLLNEAEVDSDELIVIRREIYDNGKSVCRVNGCNVTLALLQEISFNLGNIHTQFDNQKLVNPKNYFDFIDDECIKELLISYEKKLKEYNKVNREYQNLIKTSTENNQKLDFYRYQYNELEKANLSIDEEGLIKQRLNILNNHEKIDSLVHQFVETYDDNQVLDNIYETVHILEKLAPLDNKYQSLAEVLNDKYYEINDIVEEVRGQTKNHDYDDDELSSLNERLSIYSDFKRKYKMTTEELVNYFENLKIEINKIENFDDISESLKKKVNALYDEILKIALEISRLRKEQADLLVEDIYKNLVDLQLANTKIEISFESDDSHFLKNGIDKVDFLVTFNKGELLKPLSKIASGGELSRFMLALKTISAHKFKNQTLIFDEIDNGVSGSVAYSIANKIKEISKSSQVLCVTHLVQVAAISDHQLFISKESNNERTSTSVKELNYEERIEEISKMTSFGETSEASKNLAKELLEKN